MAGFIYSVIEVMFGGGIAEEVTEWMGHLWDAITTLFSNDLVGSAYKTFAAVAAALLVLYFFMELASNASRDLFTLEKLTLMIIKYAIAVVILLNSKVLMNGIVTFGEEIYNKTKIASFTATSETPTGYDSWESVTSGQVKDDKDRYPNIYNKIEDKYGGFKGIKLGFHLLIPGTAAWIIAMGCKLICYLVCTTNALNICVRAYMAPLAIPQIFEEGQRATGVRYFKTFAATCLEMALIVLTLRMASALSTALLPTIYSATSKNGYIFQGGEFHAEYLEKSLTIGNMIMTLIPHVAAASSIGGVAKVTHDIVG